MKGLSQLMQRLDPDGSSESTHRRHVGQANRAFFEGLRVAERLELTDGGEWTWDFVDPCRTMSMLIERSPGLQELVAEAWRRSPPSREKPWSIVVGFDEFVPGNKLASFQSRKTMVVSVTIKEFGAAALSRAGAWTTCAVVRSVMIGKVLQAIRLVIQIRHKIVHLRQRLCRSEPDI